MFDNGSIDQGFAPSGAAPAPYALNTPTGGSVYDSSAAQYGNANTVLSNLAQPGGIAQSMNSYVNPYISQVLDPAISRQLIDRDKALTQVGANATASNAFGGSRHGLVESEIYDNTNRNIGEMSANLMQQGFNTAGNFANQDIQNQMGAAGGLSNLAGQGFGFGQAINQNQSRQGNQQQSLWQNIISGGNQQFDSTVNSPQRSLNTQLAALTGNPLMGESGQSYQPGGFDFLSTAGQVLGGFGQAKMMGL